jgi:hypothetical protein
MSKIRQLGTRINLSEPAHLWYFPLAPISLSDEGFERVHQGGVYFPWWNIDLAPNESWSFTIEVQIEELR